MRPFTLLFLLFIPLLSSFSQNTLSHGTPGASSQEVVLQRNSHSNGLNDSLSFDPELYPFYHGVASGDPLSDRVIIWTRVSPDSTSGEIEVQWYIATDTLINEVVASGTFSTNANRDYTVKVDVEDLSPATTYYFMFNAFGRNSLIGRTRTAPEGDAEHLRFGVVSCSNYEAGFFNAYGRIAARNDLDAVIHLGDYIYEYGAGIYGDSSLTGRTHEPFETVSLDQYRSRYSLYRLDQDLRRAHQQHPFINIWDDHETANDAWKDGAENHQDSTEGSWELRKSVAKKAFYEWIPIRENEEEAIFRTLHYGNLLDLIMLDTRIEGRDQQIASIEEPALYAPDRTMMGSSQLDWFFNAVKSSNAKWKIIGNQVIFSEFNVGFAALADPSLGSVSDVESLFLDIWDGYPAERLKIINFLRNDSIDNVVFLTGDFHSSFAFDVADTVADASAFYATVPNYNGETGEGSVAVEFATPSISSANFDENLGAAASAGIEFQLNNPLPIFNTIPNPHLKWVDLDRHGYFILDVKADSTQANWYYVDRLDSLSNSESFGAATYSKDGANRLSIAELESPEKLNIPFAAPLSPRATNVSSEKPMNELGVLSIYPNPAESHFYIQFATQKQLSLKVGLLDLQGRKVKELFDQNDLSSGVFLMRIDRQDLAAGNYLLEIVTNDQPQYRRIILN